MLFADGTCQTYDCKKLELEMKMNETLRKKVTIRKNRENQA